MSLLLALFAGLMLLVAAAGAVRPRQPTAETAQTAEPVEYVGRHRRDEPHDNPLTMTGIIAAQNTAADVRQQHMAAAVRVETGQ